MFPSQAESGGVFIYVSSTCSAHRSLKWHWRSAWHLCWAYWASWKSERPDVNTEHDKGLHTVKHFLVYALDHIFTHYLAAFIWPAGLYCCSLIDFFRIRSRLKNFQFAGSLHSSSHAGNTHTHARAHNFCWNRPRNSESTFFLSPQTNLTMPRIKTIRVWTTLLLP